MLKFITLIDHCCWWRSERIGQRLGTHSYRLLDAGKFITRLNSLCTNILFLKGRSRYRVFASLDFMKPSKSFTPTCWAKRTLIPTELVCIWLLLPRQNSLLTLLLAQWRLLKSVSKRCRDSQLHSGLELPSSSGNFSISLFHKNS